MILQITTASLGVLLAFTNTKAQTPTSWQVTWENDKWAFRNEDRSYTNGVRWHTTSVQSGESSTPFWISWLANELFPCAQGDCHVRASGWALGQNFYTPDHLEIETLQAADRPYAGWLYVGLLFTAANRNHYHHFELDVGIVGDLAMAESTQKGVHKIVGATPPKGWDHQLPQEPGLALVYDGRFRVADLGLQRGSSYLRIFDTIVSVGAVAGTTFVQGEVGTAVRVGYNLTNTFLPRIGPVLAFSATDSLDVRTFRAAADYNSRFEAYIFVELEGRAVARNLFLQGTAFRASHGVDRRVGVYDAIWGVVLRHNAWSFGYQRIGRSREFKPGDRWHTYGSFAVSRSAPAW